MPSKMTNLTVALCQMNSVPGDIETNLKRIEECCSIATSRNVELYLDADKKSKPRPDLLVFPQLATVGYYAGATAHQELAQTSADDATKRLCKLAQQFNVGLLAGVSERDSVNPSLIYDAALCIDANGTVIGSYRKPHLFPETESHFTQGSVIKPIKFNGVNLGVMICADMRSPETARVLTVEGAQILIGLTHWRHDNKEDRERLLPARAVENFLPTLDVNAMGDLKTLHEVDDAEPCGNSVAYDERGTIIYRMDHNHEHRHAIVKIIPFSLYPPCEHTPYGNKHFQSRSELYGALFVNPQENIPDIVSVENETPHEQTVFSTKYVTFLRRHQNQFKDFLRVAMEAFPDSNSGYIGLIDDVGLLQIRYWTGPRRAFIQISANEGTAGYAIRTNRVYKWEGDAKTTDDPYFIVSVTSVESELVAPIRVGDGVAGVILLDSKIRNCFASEDAETKLLSVASSIGNMLEKSPEKPKIIGQDQRSEEVEAVLHIAKTLFRKPFADPSDANVVKTMATKILATAMEITYAMRGNVAMFEDGVLKIVARQGDGASSFADIPAEEERSIKKWVIRNKKAYYAPNVKGNQEKGFRVVPFYVSTHDSVLSELAVPLIAENGEAIGVINLESDNEDAFEVTLKNPSDGASIIGGKHYELFSSLAIIGTHAVTISEHFQSLKDKEKAALYDAKVQRDWFEQAISTLSVAQTRYCADQRKQLADICHVLSLMTQAKGALTTEIMQPFSGEQFLDACTVGFEQNVKAVIHGGGYVRAAGLLLKLAIREMLYFACASNPSTSIKLEMDLRGDPVKFTIYCSDPITTQEGKDAFNATQINPVTLGANLAVVRYIIAWHCGATQIENDNKERKLVIHIPRY